MPIATASTAERSAARLFTTRSFRPLIKQGTSPALDELTADLRGKLALPCGSSNSDVVGAAYDLLKKSYRNEYVYKNLIANKIFVGRHRATNSTLLNEFPMGGSVADILFINGDATVYEIKTELDNPDRLHRQLGDYYQVAPLIYVVVHESAVTRYAAQLEGTPAGLISVGARWRMSTVSAARASNESYSTRTMLNTLRVAEAEAALRYLGATVPCVPNGIRYQAFLDVALRYPAAAFHEAWRAAVKGRQLRGDLAIHRDPTLYPLRALLTKLDPTTKEESRLRRWLETKG